VYREEVVDSKGAAEGSAPFSRSHNERVVA